MFVGWIDQLRTLVAADLVCRIDKFRPLLLCRRPSLVLRGQCAGLVAAGAGALPHARRLLPLAGLVRAPGHLVLAVDPLPVGAEPVARAMIDSFAAADVDPAAATAIGTHIDVDVAAAPV